MVRGIDVSAYQGKPDWAKVKQSGIEFAILRIANSKGLDTSFEHNYAGCEANNIAKGVYRYSYAKTTETAAKEAREVVKILDGRKHTIYLSGHTHLSPNSAQGCAEYQQDGKRIYLSAGSVCPTALHAETSMSPPEWASGIYWELALREGSAELCARSVHSELKFPRGYYWFKGDETG